MLDKGISYEDGNITINFNSEDFDLLRVIDYIKSRPFPFKLILKTFPNEAEHFDEILKTINKCNNLKEIEFYNTELSDKNLKQLTEVLKNNKKISGLTFNYTDIACRENFFHNLLNNNGLKELYFINSSIVEDNLGFEELGGSDYEREKIKLEPANFSPIQKIVIKTTLSEVKKTIADEKVTLHTGGSPLSNLIDDYSPNKDNQEDIKFDEVQSYKLKIPEQELLYLPQWISKSKTINTFEVASLTLPGEFINNLSSALAKHEFLTNLKLEECDLASGFNNFCNMVANNKSIKNLNISANENVYNKNLAYWVTFNEALKNNRTIEVLDISFCKLPMDDILYALKNTNIKVLKAKGNNCEYLSSLFDFTGSKSDIISIEFDSTNELKGINYKLVKHNEQVQPYLITFRVNGQNLTNNITFLRLKFLTELMSEFDFDEIKNNNKKIYEKLDSYEKVEKTTLFNSADLAKGFIYIIKPYLKTIQFLEKNRDVLFFDYENMHKYLSSGELISNLYEFKEIARSSFNETSTRHKAIEVHHTLAGKTFDKFIQYLKMVSRDNIDPKIPNEYEYFFTGLETESQLNDMYMYLSHVPYLKTLKIHNCKNMEILCEIVSSAKYAENLDLSRNEITAEGAEKLADVIKNRNIKTLNLASNNITDESFKNFARKLSNDKCKLETINFSSNKISDQSIIQLSMALALNKTIKNLIFIDNKVTGLGFGYLARALPFNILEIINFDFNQIDDDGIFNSQINFAEALKSNSSLIELRLMENEITFKGARHLADALRNNTTLRILGLQGNKIGERGLNSIQDALKNNSTLIDFSPVSNETLESTKQNYKICGEGFRKYMSELKGENYLKTLEFGFRKNNETKEPAIVQIK